MSNSNSNPLLDMAPVAPSPAGEARPAHAESTVAGDLFRSMAYAGAQSPVNGAVQLVDNVAGTDFLPAVQFVTPPEPAEFGSARWHAQQIGYAAGMVAPFLILHKTLHGGAPLASSLASVRATAVTGTIYGGVLTPTLAGEDPLTGRLRNAAVSGATFATLSASSIGLKTLGAELTGTSAVASGILKNEVAAGVLSGLPAGLVSADSESLLSGHGLADSGERLRRMYTFSMVGGVFGGKDMLADSLKARQIVERTERTERTEPTERPARLTEAEIRELRVAELADGKDGEWIKLYNDAFPDSEAYGTDQFQALIDRGEVKLFETRNKDNELVHFTLLETYPARGNPNSRDFLLNSYTATRADMRGRGIGTVHLGRVLEQLKAENPEHLGVLAEIESPREQGLDAETARTRQRRRSFYDNLGFREIRDYEYLSPSWEEGEAPLPMDLILYPFKPEPLTGNEFIDVVQRLYNYGYEMDLSDPFIAEQTARIKPDGSY
ncbi:MAG: hypothetical protein KC777_25860 [Cyanobacteria bacterium HKST-UBA02]|nr:hypothetical protein [Cyanobacteria bacterium HKST-UBA02]